MRTITQAVTGADLHMMKLAVAKVLDALEPLGDDERRRVLIAARRICNVKEREARKVQP
jgi:hypothetical protein